MTDSRGTDEALQEVAAREFQKGVLVGLRSRHLGGGGGLQGLVRLGFRDCCGKGVGDTHGEQHRSRS